MQGMEAMMILLAIAVLLLPLSSSLQSAKIGPYTIIYSNDSLPYIQIQHGNTESDGKLIWFTSLNDTELLIAEKVQQTVSQNGGDYVIEETVLNTCNEAILGTMSINPDQSMITVSGLLCVNTTFDITFTIQSHGHLGFNVTLFSNYYNKIRFQYGCNNDEGFYGLGQQYSFINYKGYSVPLFISEQGVGRGAQPITLLINYMSPGGGGNSFTTYSRVPFYFTSYTRSLFIESLDYAVLHFTKEDIVEIEINSTNLIGRIITGDSALAIIESFTGYSGRMKPLPDWIHNGAILGLQGGTRIVTGVLNKVKDIIGSWDDIAGLWLQDWTGQRNVTGDKDLARTGLWWNWEVDRQHYTKWEEFIRMLDSQGIRIMTYINPLFNNVSQRGTPFNHNYYQEGLEKNYFIKHGPNNQVWSGYSNSHLVDLTNPMAYDWISEMIIQNMITSNVSGWMCDFGESVPLDANLYNNSMDPLLYHTMYSEIWGRLNMETIEKALNRNIITKEQASNIVYYMRSGNTHSPSVSSLFWLGDQLVTWDHYDGLGSAIIGAINSGLSGYTMTHSDIGGYTSIILPVVLSYIRSEHLLMRWCEYSAFTVVYRSHQGTLPDQNVQFYTNNKTMRQYFRMARVHKAWKFYRNDLIREAVDYGWPIIRHMMLVFPENPKVFTEDLSYQYMLGTEILVAPVHEEWAESTWVFLPANVIWIHVWTNAIYEGNNNWAVIAAPMGYPAVFYPQGSRVGSQFAHNLLKILGPPEHYLMKSIRSRY